MLKYIRRRREEKRLADQLASQEAQMSRELSPDEEAFIENMNLDEIVGIDELAGGPVREKTQKSRKLSPEEEALIANTDLSGYENLNTRM